MRLQTFRTKPDLQRAATCRALQTAGVGHDASLPGIYTERTWRCLAEAGRLPVEADILVTRWVDPSSACRCERVMSSSDRHVIGVALKTTRLKFANGPHSVFDGIMRAGTLHVTGPSQLLAAEFRAPCDFIHFHVSNDYFRRCQGSAYPNPLNDLVIRDPLAELLCRSLIERGDAGDGPYVESVGQTLVMHIARMKRPQSTVNAMPKWRLRRVQEYIDTHFHEPLSLADLAAVAGLSRMHFAAQFRAATGYRPHDYLLCQRIESAKAILSNTGMPLAQVAVALGFQAQAHFSTVFKRLTGETPARWRRNVISERQLSGTSRGSPQDTPKDISKDTPKDSWRNRWLGDE
jgi:AraC family transcriptional regulator